MTDTLLGLDETQQPVAATAPYRVLARKYRPQTFRELIGQDAMVQTLGNAIKRDRLAHAFLLTGVRGVGKTSTARLIAKALNCVGPDGQGGPTIDPCGVCEPCRAIAEGRHIDVIEMDAASHTGIDDVREIIEASRYAAVSARYKIYIVDEVHMLSKAAFNGLLKTLEEPPSHVKFLFATTEVNKVPVTVLSRCQRFDLRRISAETLANHFAMVVEAEGAQAEPEALHLIARAADGSARDGLSILDQAIAHADLDGSGVTAAAVRDMLGLSDRGAVRGLLGDLLGGDATAALAALRRQYDLGVDPLSVVRALLEMVHAITVLKVGAVEDPALAAEERDALREWASGLSFPALHRLWQLLLKGHEEVANATLPIESAQMALLRVIHATSLPDPGELARRLEQGATIASQTASPSPTTGPAPAARASTPTDFAALIAHLDAHGRVALAARLRHAARVVSYIPPEIAFSGTRPIATDLLTELGQALHAIDGRRWKLSMVDAPGMPTLHEAVEATDQAKHDAALNEPIVRAILDAFPDAELIEPAPKKRSFS